MYLETTPQPQLEQWLGSWLVELPERMRITLGAASLLQDNHRIQGTRLKRSHHAVSPLPARPSCLPPAHACAAPGNLDRAFKALLSGIPLLLRPPLPAGPATGEEHSLAARAVFLTPYPRLPISWRSHSLRTGTQKGISGSEKHWTELLSGVIWSQLVCNDVVLCMDSADFQLSSGPLCIPYPVRL